ncbi:MAG: ABC transporter [Deltaproteobacteria bacterium]|nr:MAG: ABC transporter [Deltaproteobacteria bacterium]
MSHICISGLCKEYVERRRKVCFRDTSGVRTVQQILADINLEFEDGEMVCILGPSGCGKSTLLKIVAGFTPSTAGKVLIDGKPVNGPSQDHIFVYQHSALLPWMTVQQNVGLGLRNIKAENKRNDRIQEYIDMVELTGFEDRYPCELSGGMQRRAELARALAVNPKTLFMDEPFTGLDFLTHMRMREEVVMMHLYTGKSVIFVTHDIDDALVMGDRIVILSGRPATVQLNRRLAHPHPRKLTKDPELLELRREVFFMLGVPDAV